MVCRIGQETIQEIVSRTCEVFGYLRQLQPPFGSQNGGTLYVLKIKQICQICGWPEIWIINFYMLQIRNLQVNKRDYKKF